MSGCPRATAAPSPLQLAVSEVFRVTVPNGADCVFGGIDVAQEMEEAWVLEGVRLPTKG